MQARLPQSRYRLKEKPLLVERSNADKPRCAKTAVLLSLSGIRLSLIVWIGDQQLVSLLASRLVQIRTTLRCDPTKTR